MRIEVVHEAAVTAATDEAIRRLQRTAFPATEAFRRGRYYIHRPRPDDAYVLAWEGDRLVGQAVLYVAEARLGRTARRVACLGNVCSDPDHRGRGVAGACVRRAIEIARERGAAWVLLFCRPPADGFYRRLDFEPVDGDIWHTRVDGTTYAHGGDDLAMAAPLDDEPWPDGPVVLDIENF